MMQVKNDGIICYKLKIANLVKIANIDRDSLQIF